MRCSLGRYLKQIKGYPDKPQTIGEHLKKRRIELGLKQKELAARLGMHRGSIQLWERGIGEQGVKSVPVIIRFLGYVPFECDKTPGGEITFLRRCCGLTQEELAALISCNPDTVSRWENYFPSTSTKHAVAIHALWTELQRLEIAEMVKNFFLSSSAIPQ